MFFWQSLIRPCLHLVVNPLFLPSWSLLLILDFNSDTSTSCRVFFTWLDVVKGFFFTMERIRRSSTTVVLRGSPGFFILLSSPVHSFFLSESTKRLIWPLQPFLLSLWWFVLFLKPTVSLAWRARLIQSNSLFLAFVDYCDVCISCLDLDSDDNNSLQRIHC